ncbi:MAG: aldehyde ferredoxin oxidoreductase [Candidatus Heimdallarchaeota archaeon]|nr:aldehyde ferredoxin oxidoreductase [Candidatus Heimdallarchaeota archaeon]
MKNYNLLRCNLTDRTVKPEKISEEILKLYIGGRGLGVKILWDEVPPKTDALSENNKLIFSVGPLTATSAPTSGRFSCVSKSPLTGTIFDANSGGRFGFELRGLDILALIIEGKASELSYLYLNAESGIYELRSALEFSKKDTWITTDQLIEQTDSQAKIACIGPAGENKVLTACIINDKGHALGRGGLGAVMGSKNLKAIAIRGNKLEKNDELKDVSDELHLALRKNPVTKSALPVFGTPVLVNVINELGMFPTKNFQEGVFDDAPGISGEKLQELYVVRKHACAGCTIACGRITKLTEEKQGKGPEFETIWAFGSQIANNNLALICELNYLCNQVGLDTISTGNTIGCAMELAEAGLLPDFPKFGETDKLMDIIKEIAFKRGMGLDLGEGSKRFAERYGKPELSMSVKSLEIPAYDPRGAQGQGLAYATSNRGGCHLRAYMISTEILGNPIPMDRFTPQGKAGIVRVFEDLSAFVDSLVLCRFSSFALSAIDYARLLSVIYKIKYTESDVMRIGERIWNLERLYNVKAGFGAKDDQLPPRLLTEVHKIGGSRNKTVMLNQLLPEYYKLRGWNAEGIPEPSTLESLSL